MCKQSDLLQKCQKLRAVHYIRFFENTSSTLSVGVQKQRYCIGTGAAIFIAAATTFSYVSATVCYRIL
jgi:hypothetical protein